MWKTCTFTVFDYLHILNDSTCILNILMQDKYNYTILYVETILIILAFWQLLTASGYYCFILQLVCEKNNWIVFDLLIGITHILFSTVATPCFAAPALAYRKRALRLYGKFPASSTFQPFLVFRCEFLSNGGLKQD